MRSEKEVVLVTGSSGFIGSSIIRALADRYRFVGFDMPGAPHAPGVAEEIPVDLTDPGSVREGFERVREDFGDRIASCIHLAAYYSFSMEEHPLYRKLTVEGTKRMLEHLNKFQTEQFVFSSTMLLHEPCEPGQHIDETWPINPRWPYPESKVEAERVIREHHGAIPYAILRISGVYDDACNAPVLANQMQRIYERDITGKLFPGDAAHGQSFMHIDDLADAFGNLIERRKNIPRESVYILGERDPVSYDELQHTFGRLIHDESWETGRIPEELAVLGAWIQEHAPGMEEPFIKSWMVGMADDHYALDTTRAEEQLGWEPKRSLRETLPKMVAALKRDPKAFYEAHDLHGSADLTQHGKASLK